MIFPPPLPAPRLTGRIISRASRCFDPSPRRSRRVCRSPSGYLRSTPAGPVTRSKTSHGLLASGHQARSRPSSPNHCLHRAGVTSPEYTE